MTKDIGTLKRPDLHGRFVCKSCGQIFAHAASLNRHRRIHHSCEYSCLLCGYQLAKNENIHKHMRIKHSIQKVFVCSCCNYAFDDKRTLIVHTQTLAKTGSLGVSMPIAKTSHEPGSLVQSAIQGPLSLLTTSSSSSSTSAESTREPTPFRDQNEDQQIKMEESKKPKTPAPMISMPAEPFNLEESCEKLLNDAVEKILKTGVYSSEQLILPETWERIVNTARVNVIKSLESKVKVSKRRRSTTTVYGQEPCSPKRAKVESSNPLSGTGLATIFNLYSSIST